MAETLPETEGAGSSQDAALDKLAEMERATKVEAESAEATKPEASAPGAEAQAEQSDDAISEAPSAPQTYVVQAGDSLSAISERVYGDPKYWDTIFEHNKDKISDPNVIEPGQELVIP